MTLSFEKYSGLGNDFIFFEDSDLTQSLSPLEIQRLCHRHQGIGADGVILVKSSDQADAFMSIYNSDGSRAEMCGNALRCLYLFLEKRNPDKQQFVVQTLSARHTLKKEGEFISASLCDVPSIDWNLKLHVLGKEYTGHFLNTGVPHFVVPVSNLHQLPVLALGAALRHHPRFAPNGTNVNFISSNSKKEIEVRTYERGVESETLACGTGCAASAIVGAHIFGLKAPITTLCASKESLQFNFNFSESRQSVHSLIMMGKAQYLFEGKIELVEQVLMRS